MYEFSVPMPFFKEHIDKLISINKEIEKSKITSLYFSLPTNSTDFTGFEQDRFNWDIETDFNYWKPLIEYTLNNGFDFIYVLNSPIIHYEHDKELYTKLDKLNRLIENLEKLGINKIRLCNPQLMGYISKNYPYIELYLSTSSEIKTIKDYSNLFLEFKNIKECVPSWDVNKNFKLLKNLQSLFPNIKLELMVNEGCLPSCPFRNVHNSMANRETNLENYFYSCKFITQNCSKKMKNDIACYLANNNIIYPWEINEYSKIGINNFKLVGRNSEAFITGKYLEYYKYYLKGVDDIKNILDLPIRYFNHYIFQDKNINLKVKEIKSYLPDIKHFIKQGHLCSTICNEECNYCFKCARKIQKVFDAKHKNEMTRTIKMCVCN